MGDEERSEDRGLQVFAELLGAEAKNDLDKAIQGGFGARFAKHAAEYVFGNVWGESSLARRDQSLLTLGALVALRMGDEINNHVKIAKNNGLSDKEIEEAITHLAAYVGFPAASAALGIAHRVLFEDELEE